MSQESQSTGKHLPVHTFRIMTFLLGFWIVGAQIASVVAMGSVTGAIVFGVIGALGLMAAGMTGSSRTARPLSLCIALLGIIVSWSIYGRGQESWAKAYESSALLRHYGNDPLSLTDMERFQEQLRSGQVNWLETQQTLAQIRQNPPTKFEMGIFKTRRYLRQLLWPPLAYQRWRAGLPSDEQSNSRHRFRNQAEKEVAPLRTQASTWETARKPLRSRRDGRQKLA